MIITSEYMYSISECKYASEYIISDYNLFINEIYKNTLSMP